MDLVKAGQTMSGARWYAAHVRPHAERIACANLERQNFRTFLPVQRRTVRHARQFRTSLAPMFPGYVFTAFDPARDRWRAINSTIGIVSLVMAGDHPLPVPQGLVETLMTLPSFEGRYGEALSAGQKVRMLTGPFAEMIGTLDCLDDRGRVQVLLTMMGTQIPVRSTVDLLIPA